MQHKNILVFLAFFNLLNFTFAQSPVPKFVDVTRQYEKYLRDEHQPSRHFILTAMTQNFTLIYRAEMPTEKIVDVLRHLRQLMNIINQTEVTKEFGKVVENCKLILCFVETNKPSTPDDMDLINYQLAGVNRSEILHPFCIVGVVKYWNLTSLEIAESCMKTEDFDRLQLESPPPLSMNLIFENESFTIPIGIGIGEPSEKLPVDHCVPLLPPPSSPSILIVNVVLPPPLHFPMSPSLLENYLNDIIQLEHFPGFSRIEVIYRCTLPQNPKKTRNDDTTTKNKRLAFIVTVLFEWSRKYRRGIAIDSEFDLVQILKDNFDMTAFWTYAERGGIIPKYRIVGSEITREYCTHYLVEIVTQTRSIFPVINIQIEREYWNVSLNCIQDSSICSKGSEGIDGFSFYLDTSDFDFVMQLPLEEWTDINNRVAELSLHCGSVFLGRTFPQDGRTSTRKAPRPISFPYGITEPLESHCLKTKNCDKSTLLRGVNYIVWEFALLLQFYQNEDRGQAFVYFADKIQPRLENYWYTERLNFRSSFGDTFEILFRVLPYESFITEKTILSAPALCSTISSSIDPYIEALVNWAGFRNVPLMLGSIDVKSSWKSFTYPRWLYSLKKPISSVSPELSNNSQVDLRGTFLELGGFPQSMRFRQGVPPLCLNATELLSKPSVFNTTLAGVIISLRIGPRELTHEEVKVMLLFAFHRFHKVGIILSESPSKDMTTLMRILSNDFFHRVGVKETSIALYLHNPTNVDLDKTLTDKLQRNFASSLTIFISTREVEYQQFTFENPKTWVHSNGNLKGRDKIGNNWSGGLSLGNCYSFASQPKNISKILKISGIKFVTCNWEILGIAIKWESESSMSDFLEGVLYMKKHLEKILLPNRIEIQFIFVQNQTLVSEEVVLNFFGAVKAFAEIHKINYFIPGFSADVSSKSGNVAFAGLSWWKIQNLNKSLTLPLNYVEREADYLRLTTWRPKLPSVNHKPTNYSTLWISTAVVAVTLLIVSGIVFVIVRRKFRAVLSKQEVDEFYMRCLDGVGFNPDFQLSKSDIIIEYDHVLGKGKFGIVFKGKLGDFECAVKMPHDDTPKESFKSLLTEVKVLSRLEPQENVLRFMGSCTKDIRIGQIYVVTELCEIGSLESYLRICEAEDRGLVQKLVTFSREIAAGMEHISANNLIHGDLASRNVLLNRNLTCKISDFGFSRELDESQLYVKTSGEPIPWKWMAIESLEKLEFTTQSDVWSYGVTLWEIFSLGSTPYPGYDLTVEFVGNLRDGMRMAKPALARDEVFVTFRECWNLDPRDRPSFTSMKEYFTGLETSEYSTIQ